MKNFDCNREDTNVYTRPQVHEHGSVSSLTKAGGDGCCEGRNIVWGGVRHQPEANTTKDDQVVSESGTDQTTF